MAHVPLAAASRETRPLPHRKNTLSSTPSDSIDSRTDSSQPLNTPPSGAGELGPFPAGYLPMFSGSISNGIFKPEDLDDSNYDDDEDEVGTDSWEGGQLGPQMSSSSSTKKRKVPSHPIPSPHSPPTRLARLPSLPVPPKGFIRNGISLWDDTNPSTLASKGLMTGYKSISRVTPACRAFLWQKAVWRERRRQVAEVLSATGGEALKLDEGQALEFEGFSTSASGGTWWDGSLKKTPSNDAGTNRSFFRRRFSQQAQSALLSTGRRMKNIETPIGRGGIKEVLTDDGLSITAIVREVLHVKTTWPIIQNWMDWSFTFEAPSGASARLDKKIAALSGLQTRIAKLSAALPESNSDMPSKGGSFAALPPSKQHLQQPETRLNVGTQTSATPPTVAEAPQARLVIPRPLTTRPQNIRNSNVKLPSAKPTTAPKKTLDAPTLAGSKPASIKSPKPEDPLTLANENLPPMPKRKTGKKKRSALANNGNPHHMKNYVPGRLLDSSSTNNQTQSDFLFPLPTRFLSAYPARRRNAALAAASDGQEAEYICVFCEYSLLYSSNDAARKKAISKRKKLLARRRRAKAKAAGLANGTSTLKKSKKVETDDDDDDGDCDEELPDGQCRRCAERRAKEERKGKRGRKKNHEMVDIGTSM